MLRPFKLSPMVLLSAVVILATGELLTGTSLYFATIMALTMLCIGVTYNILGGISSIGGIGFTALALRTIVISQIGKIVFSEPADQNIEVPQLTITIYLLFYISLMIGAFVFGRIRLKLPRAMELVTAAQTNKMYFISLVLGTLVYLINSTSAGGQAAGRGFVLDFGAMLLFSVVLGVGSRIRSTDGLHSFGIKAFIPWLLITIYGLLGATRAGVVLPTLTYALTCYVNGFRFSRKHYFAAVLGIVTWFAVVSPFEMYMRQFRENLSWKENIGMFFHQLTTLPDWSVVEGASQSAQDAGGGGYSYFNRPGTFVLSRLSLIRTDSNLIYACSGGYHYGFVALKNDLLLLVPNFIYKDKPTVRSGGFIGHVSGMTSDEMDNNHTTTTAIADSFGAFGWLGVMLAGFLAFPIAIVVYESMFDIRRPWGILALGVFCTGLPESDLGSLAELTIRMSTLLFLLSLLLGTIVRAIPSKGDR